MCAYDGADGLHAQIRVGCNRRHSVLEFRDEVVAVRPDNEHGSVVDVAVMRRELVHNVGHRFFGAYHLGEHAYLPFLIDVKHGLRLKDVAHTRLGGRESSAAGEITQVAHHEIYLDFPDNVGKVVVSCVDVSVVSGEELCREIHQDTRAETNVQSVELAVTGFGKLRFQFRNRRRQRLERVGHLGGKRNVKYIFARFEIRTENVEINLFVQPRRTDGTARPHLGIKILEIRIFAEVVHFFLAVDGVRHTYDFDAEFLRRGVPQFAVGIAK